MAATGAEDAGPIRILWVFAWLVVGGEETELRLLARNLDPSRYRIDVVACFRKDGMPDQTHDQLAALGIDVDTTPYSLSFEDTVDYLTTKLPAYDLLISSQNVADVYPALERLHFRPPLIEHGGLVSEALAGPKHFTARYVGVCRTIREAAAARMPDRMQHAVEIPSMVDLGEFRPEDRAAARSVFGFGDHAPVFGWVGRLDRKKRAENFVRAAALVAEARPAARFVVVGGPDAFMPEYAEELRALASHLRLDSRIRFLGDRSDVPLLMSGFDALVWLARGEGMPHVVAEAGAARLPVIATPDGGVVEQVEDGVSGVFVPHENPGAVADAMVRLLDDRPLRERLGTALRNRVERDYAANAVVPRWCALFDAVLHERVPAPKPALFRSFLQGGFEASTHRRADGTRLDVLAAIGHDKHAAVDYRTLTDHGLRTVRDGLRWHLIEAVPGRYDWSSFLPMLRAARQTGMQVIWDLMHYGWPDDIDIWRPVFVDRFARFSAAAARVMREEGVDVPFFTPVNEISFLAWAGGDVGYLNPFGRGRAHELKVQLARAAIAAMDAVWSVEPRARFVHADPVINIICDPARPHEKAAAEMHRQGQFQGWDMIAGLSWPQLGGSIRHLDTVGVNYYCNNQWIHGQGPIDHLHPGYRPFRHILSETYARYGRPIFVAETGIEDDRRASWLASIGTEVRAARQAGVPVEGICLYPIADHPGWDNDRHCPNGLLGLAPDPAGRLAHGPLADELQRQQQIFAATW